MQFIPEAIDQYAVTHTKPESKALLELSRETHAKIYMPQMLSGHLQGRFLSMVSKLVQPKNILEIGTFTGYSAICLCEGLKPGGHLYTIDINEELLPMTTKYFKAAGISDRVKSLTGDALKIIPSIKATFELVFIDADKTNYSRYYDLVFDKMPSGGVILADNVLWSGKVIGNDDDADTIGIRKFNEKVQKDKRVENVLLPIRDGVMMIRKK